VLCAGDSILSEPLKTIELLEQLIDLGFNDEYFDIVHHFEGETIEQHQKYCSKHSGRFQSGGTNEQVQRRLKIVLDSFVGGRFENTEVFRFLAHASVKEIPYAEGVT
jgi:hypothetical protein